MSFDATREPVISFEGVRIGFDEGEILHGVNLRVASRETKILVGETGSGKTLLLKLAAGLLRPDAGRVRVLGQEISALPEKELLDFRRQVGFVFQEGALFDSMSVEENVAYRLREEAVDEAEIEQRVREALRFVELEEAIDKLPGELSGGMRRRVSIARALITAPPIVLYDSPTAGLDPVTAQTIITLILRLRDAHGVTALLATHRLQDAFAMVHYRFDAEGGRVVPVAQNGAGPATNFVVLREGAICFEGDFRAISESADSYVQKFLV
ncbi:MAG: ATP-binding cassette domain-containing protein [Acidobacteria bacterium]|nr:ATP-binding cassette domain-containing protein [Acidobacteriota bacterium]MCL5289303.1 ATP-binding cassette domain-containing protein [Acidobacteriota bacterium]